MYQESKRQFAICNEHGPQTLLCEGSLPENRSELSEPPAVAGG